METINEKVKQRIDNIFSRKEEHYKQNRNVLYENLDTIRRTIVDYQYLRYIYTNKTETSLSENQKFKALFRSFYVMRYVGKNSVFEKEFFKVMDEIREGKRTNLNVIEITKELHNKVDASEDKKKNAFHLSFVSKMLNLHDDTKFPIYDSQVGAICGVKSSDKLEEKYAKVQAVYQYIQEIKDFNISIRLYRNSFGEKICKTVSDERLIDIVLWVLGKKIQKEQEQQKKTKEQIKKENDDNIKNLVSQGYKKADIINKGIERTAVFEWFYKNK